MTPYERGTHEAESRLRTIRSLYGPARQAAQEQLAGFLSVVTAADVSQWGRCTETDPKSEQCTETVEGNCSTMDQKEAEMGV